MKYSLKIDPLLLPALVSFGMRGAPRQLQSRRRRNGSLRLGAVAVLAQPRDPAGVRLLARTTRRVALTDEGARILEGVRDGLASLGGALDALEVRRSRPAGTVRITLPRMTFGRYFPHLAAFARLHPEVSLEFALEDRLVDIVADGFDVGVRMGEQIAADMVALQLGGPERLVTVGSPDYFRRHPPRPRPSPWRA